MVYIPISKENWKKFINLIKIQKKIISRSILDYQDFNYWELFIITVVTINFDIVCMKFYCINCSKSFQN